MKKKIYIIIAIVVVALIIYLILGRSSEDTGSIPEPPTGTSLESEPPQVVFNFEQFKKSAHYESNTPEHGSIIPAVPVNAVIDVNFDLAPPSAISINKDGSDYGVGETTIDSNKLAMRRVMAPDAPDGLYTVNYNTCWPDGSCHDGHFQFAIDRSRAGAYEDLRDNDAVTVSMGEIAFDKPKIRVSRGTKVTWENYDEVEHYINTDSHPSHSYYPMQNSRALAKARCIGPACKNLIPGGTYSLIFDTPGFYPYHCSAHAEEMISSIIVE